MAELKRTQVINKSSIFSYTLARLVLGMFSMHNVQE